MATERVGELGSATGAAQPGLFCGSSLGVCQAAVCANPLGFVMVKELVRFGRVATKYSV